MMDEEISDELKLALYKIIVERYTETICKEEEKSVTEIRSRISPYGEFIKSVKDRLISDLSPYEYEKNFFQAVQSAIVYIKGIKTFRAIPVFWMTFEEIDKIKVASAMDKALYLAAILRALESKDVKVMVSKKENVYVGFTWDSKNFLIAPESGSLLSGEDASSKFSDDPLSYAFSDLFYENYEES
jgi:hypothetical protein